MSLFIEHSACPKCGSKDNLAIYTDHKWCFGCGYWEPIGHRSPSKHQLNEPTKFVIPYLPEDVNTAYPGLAEEWIKKYDLTRNILYQNQVLWSDQRKLLIFPIYDESHTLWGWQGRYFGEDPEHPKWTSKGKYKDLIQIKNLTQCKDNGIIIVEDIISSIKLSTLYSTSCLYGSYIDIYKYINIYNIYKPNKLIIWLDYDKRKEANEYCLKLNNLGIPTRVIITSKDPKEYSYTEIKEFLEPKTINSQITS